MIENKEGTHLSLQKNYIIMSLEHFGFHPHLSTITKSSSATLCPFEFFMIQLYSTHLRHPRNLLKNIL